MARARRFGVVVAFFVFVVAGVVFTVAAAAALAPVGSVGQSPPVDPVLDWIVKVALALLAIFVPLQTGLAFAFVRKLGQHDLALQRLDQDKVSRETCESTRHNCPPAIAYREASQEMGLAAFRKAMDG